MDESQERAQLTSEILAIYATRDELGQALFHLALHAATRDDMDMMRAFLEIDRMPRHGGQVVDLNCCEAFGAVGQRVKGAELGHWARATSAIMDIGDPSLLHALDNLARRRACH